MSWQQLFPDYDVPVEILRLVAGHDAFEDVSFGYKSSPNFAATLPFGNSHVNLLVYIRVEHPDPEKRELKRFPRFSVGYLEHGEYNKDCFLWLDTDDADTAVKYAHWMWRHACDAYADVKGLMAYPVHPDRPVTDFGSLHEHCDANVLGVAEEVMHAFGDPEADNWNRSAGFLIVKAVQEMLNLWMTQWRFDPNQWYENFRQHAVRQTEASDGAKGDLLVYKGLWINDHRDGTYSTIAERDIVTGTFRECTDLLFELAKDAGLI